MNKQKLILLFKGTWILFVTNQGLAHFLAGVLSCLHKLKRKRKQLPLVTFVYEGLTT